jgi:phosphohistidine phosphatase
VLLYLIRHAEAASGAPDELRPLTPAGIDTARSLGRRLRDEDGAIAVVLCSPLLRARQTAEAIADELGVEADPVDGLAPGATAEHVVAAVAGRGGAVAVVGHQPDCGRIAAALAGGPEPPFPPGGMLRLDVPA